MVPSQLWSEKLESWAIPQEIIDQAPESPWIHPAVLFQIPQVIDLTPSHARAFEALKWKLVELELAFTNF